MSGQLTDDELREIRARAEPVPGWTLEGLSKDMPTELPWGPGLRAALPPAVPYVDVALRLPDGSSVLVIEHAKTVEVGLAGLTFLLHAPADVHALLAEVDRLRDVVEQLEWDAMGEDL